MIRSSLFTLVALAAISLTSWGCPEEVVDPCLDAATPAITAPDNSSALRFEDPPPNGATNINLEFTEPVLIRDNDSDVTVTGGQAVISQLRAAAPDGDGYASVWVVTIAQLVELGGFVTLTVSNDVGSRCGQLASSFEYEIIVDIELCDARTDVPRLSEEFPPSPADNSEFGSASLREIEVTFDYPMNTNNFGAVLYENRGQGNQDTFNLLGVWQDQQTITFNVTQVNFFTNTSYELDLTGFDDICGFSVPDDAAGGNGALDFRFNSALDDLGPVVESCTPAEGEQGVPPTLNRFRCTFNEVISLASLGGITLITQDGMSTNLAVSADRVEPRVVEVTRVGGLDFDIPYAIDFTGIEDLAANRLGEDQVQMTTDYPYLLDGNLDFRTRIEITEDWASCTSAQELTTPGTTESVVATGMGGDLLMDESNDGTGSGFGSCDTTMQGADVVAFYPYQANLPFIHGEIIGEVKDGTSASYEVWVRGCSLLEGGILAGCVQTTAGRGSFIVNSGENFGDAPVNNGDFIYLKAIAEEPGANFSSVTFFVEETGRAVELFHNNEGVTGVGTAWDLNAASQLMAMTGSLTVFELNEVSAGTELNTPSCELCGALDSKDIFVRWTPAAGTTMLDVSVAGSGFETVVAVSQDPGDPDGLDCSVDGSIGEPLAPGGMNSVAVVGGDPVYIMISKECDATGFDADRILLTIAES